LPGPATAASREDGLFREGQLFRYAPEIQPGFPQIIERQIAVQVVLHVLKRCPFILEAAAQRTMMNIEGMRPIAACAVAVGKPADS
jgi:hypothetical protein